MPCERGSTRHENCDGMEEVTRVLDERRTVVACVLKGRPGREPVSQTKSFGTTTAEVMEMLEWFKEQEVTHGTMEATGDMDADLQSAGGPLRADRHQRRPHESGARTKDRCPGC